MKLDLAKNIRRLRRERELSQEQLAEAVGVSVQSVSHWETANTYPDMELLPTLAGFFGVTTDELLGVSGEARKQKYWDEFNSIPREDSRACEAVLRRAWAEFPREWGFARWLCIILNRDPANCDEVIRIATSALDACPVGAERWFFIRAVALTADEKSAFEFLERYITDSNGTHAESYMWRDTLLQRYHWRGEEGLEASMRQLNRIRLIEDALFDFIRLCQTPPDPEDCVRLAAANLEYLNVIVGIDEETRRSHPVLGDGVPDLWVETRVMCGLRLSSQLLLAGRIDESLEIFEETTEVCCRFNSLPDGSVLSYRIDPSGALDARITIDENGQRCVTFVNRIGFEPEGRAEVLMVPKPWCAGYPEGVLNIINDWDSFDVIREHPKFLACVERIKKAASAAKNDGRLRTLINSQVV